MSKTKTKKTNEAIEKEETENEVKEYKVIAEKLRVRNDNNDVVDYLSKNDKVKGILENDKVYLLDGNSIVAKFVKEVK